MKIKDTVKFLERCNCAKLMEIMISSIDKNATDVANYTGKLLLAKFPDDSADLLLKNFHRLSRGLQTLMIEKKNYFAISILKAINEKDKSYFNAQKFLLQLNDIDSLELIKEVLFICDKSLAIELGDVIEQIVLDFKQVWIYNLKNIQTLIYTDEEARIIAKLRLLELESMSEKIIEIVDTLLFVIPMRIPDEMIVIMLFLGPNRYASIPLSEIFSYDDPEIRFLSDYTSWRVLSEALVDSNIKVSLKVKEAILKNENFDTPAFLMFLLENKLDNVRKIAVHLFSQLKSIHSLKGLLNLRNRQNFRTRRKLIEKAGTVPYISLCIRNITYLSNQIAFELLKDADVVYDLSTRFSIYAELLNFDDASLINKIIKRFKNVRLEQYFNYLFDALLIPLLTTQKIISDFLFKTKLTKIQKFKVINRMISSPFADIREVAKANINDDIMNEIWKNEKSEVFRFLKLQTSAEKKESNKFIALIRNKLLSSNQADVLKGLNLIDINSKSNEKLYNNLLSLLQNRNPAIKAATIRILWKLDTKPAIESIISLLKSTDVEQQLIALDVIEEINDKRFTVYLDEIINSKDSHLKARAISVLFKLTQDENKLLPELRKMITSTKPEDVKAGLNIVNVFEIDKVIALLEEFIICDNNPKGNAGILKAINKLRGDHTPTEELRLK